METITRIGFCKKCEKSRSKRRLEGDLFLLFMGTSQLYSVATVEEDKFIHQGFTPHIFTLERIENNVHIVKSICCMDGCGVDITNIIRTLEYSYKILNSRTIIMSKERWTGLVEYKDKNYYIPTKSYRKTRALIPLLREHNS